MIIDTRVSPRYPFFMQAKQELTQLKEKLQKHIAVLNAEMDTVDKAIRLLDRENESSGVTGQQDKRFAKVGLSDTCRQIVGNEWISPTEVRDAMMQGGYKKADKGKLLGSVFATLKRLSKSELEGKRVDGKMKYRKRQAAAMAVAEAA